MVDASLNYSFHAWKIIKHESESVFPALCCFIKSINANMFSSFKDDYIKNPEENTASDESKSQ